MNATALSWYSLPETDWIGYRPIIRREGRVKVFSDLLAQPWCEVSETGLSSLWNDVHCHRFSATRPTTKRLCHLRRNKQRRTASAPAYGDVTSTESRLPAEEGRHAPVLITMAKNAALRARKRALSESQNGVVLRRPYHSAAISLSAVLKLLIIPIRF